MKVVRQTLYEYESKTELIVEGAGVRYVEIGRREMVT